MLFSKSPFYKTKEKVKLQLDSTDHSLCEKIFATKKEFYVDYNDFSEFFKIFSLTSAKKNYQH